VSVPGEGEAVAAAYAQAMPAATATQRDETDDLVWAAPRWVVPLGAVFVALLIVVCFLVFWRGMGTSVRQSAVEAFGVAFGLLVVLSVIGACLAARQPRRPAPPPPPR
jgi:hypothetical protein